MSQSIDYKRASIERRVLALRYEIYRLALEDISEGSRTEKLRALLAERQELQEMLKATIHPSAHVGHNRLAPQRFGLD